MLSASLNKTFPCNVFACLLAEFDNGDVGPGDRGPTEVLAPEPRHDVQHTPHRRKLPYMVHVHSFLQHIKSPIYEINN